MSKDNSSKYRLTYFNMKSLGEPSRWILEYTGTPYVDDRIPSDMIAWYTQRKAEFGSTVGQVPVLHETGKRELSQSGVISRYLASQNGLVGDTPWDNARIDEVISLLFDLYDAWRKATVLETDAARKTESMSGVIRPKFKIYYEKFSKILEEEKGDFVLGSKLTHADFWLAHFTQFWGTPLKGERPTLPPNFLDLSDSDMLIGLVDEFPLLKKHMETVTSIPQIKDWLSRRPSTVL
ncbi:Glutathione S-transferase 3 [Orchesella cincta]|uniref:glutathione transferase n=1 Tax=Orchesella cincta TaxID=48709 RepID=A0A1D2NI45_ORCCI|nr:Glutathione S-transferase 3 [Orchesella cincta]